MNGTIAWTSIGTSWYRLPWREDWIVVYMTAY